MHRSEIGNLVYGFAAVYFRMTWLQTWAGSIAGNRGDRTNADAAAVGAGFDFAHNHKGVTVAEYLKTQDPDRLKEMCSDAPPECEPCSESVNWRTNHVTLPKVTATLNEDPFTMSVPSEVTD